MKKFIYILICVSIYACKSTVNLTLSTSDTRSHYGHLINSKEPLSPLRSIYVTNESPQKLTIKVKRNETLQIRTSPEGSNIPQTCCKQEYIVTGKEMNENIILKHGIPYLNDEGSVKKMTESFKELGDDIGFFPLNVKTALNGVIGGIVFVSISDDGPKIVYKISPTRLGNRKMLIDEMVWNDTRETSTVEIMGHSILKNNANIPFIGELGITYEDNSAYKMNWVMGGYGNYLYEGKSDFTLSTALENLKSDETQALKQLILDHIESNMAYKILYVDRFYAIKTVDFKVEKAKKVVTEGNMNNAFLTSNGVFTFNNTDVKTKNFTDMIMNISGNEIDLRDSNPITKSTEVLVKNMNSNLYFKYNKERTKITGGSN